MKTTISIAIDLEDEVEVELLNHVKNKGNRSKYIKRLIYDDMMGINKKMSSAPIQHEENDDDLKAMMDAF